MSSSFDMRELEKFEKELMAIADKTMPAATKKFLKNNSKKLAKLAKKKAEQMVKKRSGNYENGFKAGKVYRYNGFLSCRSFNNSPHAHLIEYGHLQKTKNGEIFVPGKHVLEETSKDFEDQYYEDVEKFVDQMMEEGLAR